MLDVDPTELLEMLRKLPVRGSDGKIEPNRAMPDSVDWRLSFEIPAVASNIGCGASEVIGRLKKSTLSPMSSFIARPQQVSLARYLAILTVLVRIPLV